jgi:hypothetical protein
MDKKLGLFFKWFVFILPVLCICAFGCDLKVLSSNSILGVRLKKEIAAERYASIHVEEIREAGGKLEAKLVLGEEVIWVSMGQKMPHKSFRVFSIDSKSVTLEFESTEAGNRRLVRRVYALKR